VTPAKARVLPGATVQFSALGTDALGARLNPQPMFTWSVRGGGKIDTNGLFQAGGALGGPFNISASSGSVTGMAAVDVSGNLAFNGLGYTWYGLNSSTDNSPQAPAPGLNDSDLSTDVPLVPGGDADASNAYEAAGIIWASPQTIGQVLYHNGSYDSQENGVFEAGFALQFSPDGMTWVNAGPSWTLSPPYSYNSPASADVAFAFSGGLATVQGVRCVGQIHSETTTPSSWVAFATEVEAFGPAPPALPSPVLTVSPIGNLITISWPGSLTNYALESATFLVQGSAWKPVTNAPQLSGGKCTVTLLPAGTRKFFRLHLQ
jgi:hypothetical protein